MTRLEWLRRKHRELDVDISQYQNKVIDPSIEQLIKDLKRQKLQLRDEIASLENASVYETKVM